MIAPSIHRSVLLPLVLLCSVSAASAFYVPGVHPVTFLEGEDVFLKVDALTSVHTQIPRDYYRLPFCQPEDGPYMTSQSLGELLTGSKIQTSPYTEIKMKEDLYCQVVCDVNLDKLQAAKLRLHIKYGYNHNWIVDNLPSAAIGKNPKVASQLTDDYFDTPTAITSYAIPMTRYAGGFPMGFINPDDKVPYIYNHVNINLNYHVVKASSLPTSKRGDALPNTVAGYRVVGFAVEPFSIRHEYGDDGKTLKTCPGNRTHVSRGLIQSSQGVAVKDTIIYTYDVIWKESPVDWSSRWDIYLSEDHLVPYQVHWFSIANSIVVTIMLSAALILWIRRDLNSYSGVSVLSDDDLEGSKSTPDSGSIGWSLLHADVFRPPSSHPMMYCVLCGSGVQLGVSILFVVMLSAVGLINPARRGSFVNASLIFYALGGFLAGYVSARLFKSFGSTCAQRRLCTRMTADLVPGLSFGVFLFFNIMLGFLGSTGSAPFHSVSVVLVLWCGVSVPLVFWGAHLGYAANTIQFPTETSEAVQEVPLGSSRSLKWIIALLFAGILPFSTMYVELFFIMISLWMHRYYYVFGAAFTVYIILLTVCAKISMLLVYSQLRAENHRWWWYPFWCAGSTAVLTFSYSVIWFRTLEPSRLVMTYLLYFGYMLLICFYMFLVLGSVGALSSLWFVRRLYTKID
jgi:transmembrane 9 superfamily member 2/4